MPTMASTRRAERRARPAGRGHRAAERDGQRPGQQQGQHGQLRGDADAGQDLLEHGAAGPDAGAEIAVQGAASQWPYWAITGWSRPSRARMAAICSGVTSALAPSVTCTASPGIRRIIRKVSTETPKATNRRSARRRRKERSRLRSEMRVPQAAQAAGGAGLVALQVRPLGGEQGAVGQVHGRAGAGEDALRLVVQRLAGGRIGERAGVGKQLVELGVAVVVDVGGAAGGEGAAEIVVRVGAAAVQAGEGVEACRRASRR